MGNASHHNHSENTKESKFINLEVEHLFQVFILK
jgi:hypothetical protein